MPDILVLQESMHGIPSSECAASLREQRPDLDVVLAESPAAEIAHIGETEIAVGGRFRGELLERADQLKLFACSWAGVDHLDLDRMAERDIAVTNASGVHGPNIAEHVLGWFLMITRRLGEGIRRQERHEWRHFQSIGEFDGSRVCIVGLGAIGTAIVDRLAGFDVETVGVRYSPEKGGPTDEVYGFDEITEALAGVEYLAIAAPLTEETDGLIGTKEFDTLPNNAVVVNIGRGPIIDTDALLHAAQRNQIHAAGLDVTDPEPLPPDHPLWNLGNIYITPHTAGHTPYYWDRVANTLLRNIDQIDETGSYNDLENQVV